MMSEEAADIDTCPACGLSAFYLTDWRYSGLGNSIFNYTAQFYSCRGCGLVYVKNITDTRLAEYYAEECNYFENAHFSVTSPENREKYSVYAGLLRQHEIGSVPMADVGCGRGGFVSWLGQHDWGATCWGVDVDVRSLQQGCASSPNVTFRTGDALELPFEDSGLGLLTYFHVLEHIRDVHALLSEAYRVLQPGGHLLIEVPDSERYGDFPIGSAFWISIREHIVHYTARALTAVLRTYGFEVREVLRKTLPTPEFAYPSLMVLGRKTGELSAAVLTPSAGDVAAHLLESKEALLRQVRTIKALAEKQPVTIWGCSAELFSVLPLLDLRDVRICDSSTLKQKAKYRGKAVENPASVAVAGTLLIAPYLHGAAIQLAASRLGWPEHAVHLLR
jgi:ubiquinone/menaquinone biosynthesis C-methylase UbiE